MAYFFGNKLKTDQKEATKNTFHMELVQKNVLITGGNGQLGSELKRASVLSNKNLNFVFTDVDTLDITDSESLEKYVKSHHINYIINCAAYTAVDKAEDEKELCYKINRDAVRNIAIVAEKYSVKVIHISTDYVFDGTKDTPYVETDPLSPRSVYGKSKEEGEKVLIKYCSESIIIRTSWLYSIYGNNFVKTMIRLGKERSQLNVVSDQTGTPTNAADLASSLMIILDSGEREDFKSGIYHYSDMGVTNWYDFAKTIHKFAGVTSCKINPITTAEYPTKAVRPMYSVLDKSKIIQTFGLEIPQWEASLKSCIDELMKE